MCTFFLPTVCVRFLFPFLCSPVGSISSLLATPTQFESVTGASPPPIAHRSPGFCRPSPGYGWLVGQDSALRFSIYQLFFECHTLPRCRVWVWGIATLNQESNRHSNVPVFFWFILRARLLPFHFEHIGGTNQQPCPVPTRIQPGNPGTETALEDREATAPLRATLMSIAGCVCVCVCRIKHLPVLLLATVAGLERRFMFI